MKFDIPEEEYLHHAQFIIDEKLNQCRGLIMMVHIVLMNFIITE